MGAIREIVESHINQSDDEKKGLRSAAEQISRLIDQDKIKSHQVSIREVFNAFVDPDRKIDLDNSVEVSEAISSSEFPYVTGKLIHPVVIEAYDYALGDIADLVYETDSKRSAEDIVGFGASDNLEEVLEAMPYPETTVTEKRCYIANHKFGRIISLTKEMILFDQTGEILTRAAKIGEKVGIHRHRYIVEKACSLACDATDEAADKSLVYGGTAYAIFADDHSAIDAQTNDNLTTESLSTSGVSVAKALLTKMLDEKGDRIVVVPVHILVPPDLEEDAWQIYNAPEQYDETKRALNPFKGRYKVIGSPFLTDTNAWYLGNFAKQTRWQWVWKPTTEQQKATSELAFSHDIVQRYKFSYMGGCGATDYRFVVKNNPS